MSLKSPVNTTIRISTLTRTIKFKCSAIGDVGAGGHVSDVELETEWPPSLPSV